MISEDGNYRWDGTAWQPNPPPKKPKWGAIVAGALVIILVVLVTVYVMLPSKSAPPAVVGAPTTTAPTTTAPTTTTEAPTSTAPASKQERFFDELESHSLASYANTATTDLVMTVCQTITDAGVTATMNEVIRGSVKNHVDAGDLGKIFAIGVPIYCPQHSAAMGRWANQ